jgi:hypothetical protein
MPIFEEKDLNAGVTTDKGTELFNCLLLDQYRNSPNFIEYAGAFVGEFDTLFEQLERVYLGRFLEYASGEQLVTLGAIVDLPRSITIEGSNFGFRYEVGAQSFGTVGDAGIGDIFNTLTPDILELSEDLYRRAVRAKALCNSETVQSAEFMYYVISILLGQVPSTFQLSTDEPIPWDVFFGFDQDGTADTFGSIGDTALGGAWVSQRVGYSYTPVAYNKIILTIDSSTPANDQSLVRYMSRFFVPVGYNFEFNLI